LATTVNQNFTLHNILNQTHITKHGEKTRALTTSFQQLLGHRRIDQTLYYVNVESANFQTKNDRFHVQTVRTQQEIAKLTEQLEVDFLGAWVKSAGSCAFERESKVIW